MPICEPIKIGCHERDHYNTVDPHKYVAKVKEMTDDELYDACKETIWLSAYANNNPRSDYHWMCDACYAECDSRKKVEIYTKAHGAIARSI